MVTKLDTKALDKVIARYEGKPGRLLSILEDAQKLDEHQYLSTSALEYVSEKTGIPLSRIYSVVTFYAFFSLKPRGDHSITVCRGTACHTRGSKKMLDYLKQILDLKEDESSGQQSKVFLTTKDNQFTLMTVACFGQCALAPVVEIDGTIYSNVTERKLKGLIDNIRRKGKNKK
ncbi:MAG: NAD(P)H-dependent oxidoreductase subunit E [Candidatus Omnitrophica bacterium]|nr:NAD(P)H-dependent oxidoreductase subunit E [Candidatus Omnitrophota bacterium]